jgi:hypothetical protein
MRTGAPIPLLLLSLGLVACGSAKRTDDAFGAGEICGFYDQLAARPDATQLSDQQKYEAIRGHVTGLDPKLIGRQAWEAAVSAQVGQRYDAFKMMMDPELPKPFECPSMRALFQ